MNTYRHPAGRLLVLGVMLTFIVAIVPVTALADTEPVGTTPVDIDFDVLLNKAFVANYHSNTVSVISGVTNRKLADVDVRTWPDPTQSYPNAVAVNSNTHRAYVANYNSPDVVVIDTNDYHRVAILSNPDWDNEAKDVLVDDSERDLVYVAYWKGGVNGNGGVRVYRGIQASPVADLICGPNPYRMALDTGSGKVYVANANGNSVSIIDGNNLSATPVTVPVGLYPAAIAVDPSTHTVYVANAGESSISIIDGTDPQAPARDVQVGLNPQSVAFDDVTGTIYVGNLNSHTVTAIRAVDLQVLNHTPVGAWPADLALDPDFGRVFTANSHPAYNNAAMIESANGYAVTFYPAGLNPQVIRVNPANHKVYVLNKDSNDVTILENLGVSPPYDVWDKNPRYVDPTGVVITFGEVITPGNVEVTETDKVPSPPPDENYVYVKTGKTYYVLKTTATYDHGVTITFPLPPDYNGMPVKIVHWFRTPAPYSGSHAKHEHTAVIDENANPKTATITCTVLSPFGLFYETAEPVTTPASAPWSLALVAVLGIGATVLTVRLRRAR